MEKTIGGAREQGEDQEFSRGMLTVTSKWSCSIGSWINGTGRQFRALGIINIQVVFKDLKLDEVNNGLSETEEKRGPRTEPRGPSTLTTVGISKRSWKRATSELEENWERIVRWFLISVGTQAGNIVFFTDFFLWFSESMQINSTPLRAFPFAFNVQPFQALSPRLLFMSGSSQSSSPDVRKMAQQAACLLL